MSRASGSPDLVGSTALVGAVRPRLMLSDKIFRVHTNARMTSAFFVTVFNASLLRRQIERAISGADGLANNLPQSALRTFLLAIPPIAEQEKIVSFVEREIDQIEQLCSESEQAIDLLLERRAALIITAVTGQIDVRGLAAEEAA